MKQFQWSLIQLLVGLSFFLTIERIDFAQVNIIDLQSFVYVLAISFVVIILMVPQIASWPIYLHFWVGTTIFVGLKLLLFDDRPFIGGFYTYLTLTEIAFLLSLIYLAYRVAFNLREIQKAAEYISLAQFGQQLKEVEDADSEIHREMTRSRHFHRSLSVIVVEPKERDMVEAMPRLLAEIQKQTADLYLKAQLATLIDEETRVVDTVMADRENGRFIILCPEIDSQGSGLLTERIQQAIKERLGLHASFGVASFPDEAVTFESLIAAADKKLKGQQYQVAHKTAIRHQQEVLQAEL